MTPAAWLVQRVDFYRNTEGHSELEAFELAMRDYLKEAPVGWNDHLPDPDAYEAVAESWADRADDDRKTQRLYVCPDPEEAYEEMMRTELPEQAA